MPTNDLAALSAAATKGEWAVEPDMRTEFCRYTNAEMSYTAGFNIIGEDEIVGCEGIIPSPQAEANAAFIVALVNEFRAGRLVLIDREGMRERVAEALTGGMYDANNWLTYGSDRLDAAIAAMLGEG